MAEVYHRLPNNLTRLSHVLVSYSMRNSTEVRYFRPSNRIFSGSLIFRPRRVGERETVSVYEVDKNLTSFYGHFLELL